MLIIYIFSEIVFLLKVSWTKKTEIVDVVIVNSVMCAEGVGKG
jgi:hypothetical protein